MLNLIAARIVFSLQVIAIAVWTVFATTLVLLVAIPRWGDPNLNKFFMKILSWGIFRITRIEFRIEGKEYIGAFHPCIYLGNHQSGLDVLFYGSACPDRTVVIGKKEIAWIPIIGWYYLAAANIVIDRKNHKEAVHIMNSVAEKIRKQNLSVGLMPEGTRNKGTEPLLPFKKGAFHLAIAAQAPIIIAVCSPMRLVFDPGNKKIPGGIVTMKVLPPILTTGLGPEDVDSLLEKVRTEMLAAIYELRERSSKT